MKKAPTLIDEVYRSTFSKDNNGWSDIRAMRETLLSARRFVLDDGMSAFLGDLSLAAFLGQRAERRVQIVDQLRRSARLPHSVTWIEYSLREMMARQKAIIGRPFEATSVPSREGWLLEQHPQIDTAFRVCLFIEGEEVTEFYVFPMSYMWTVDDETVLPWRTKLFPPSNPVWILPDQHASNTISEVATGIVGYKTDRVGTAMIDKTPPGYHARLTEERLAEVISEWGGCLRRMWALLATINDLPVVTKEVVAAKGFMARHNYRRFLNHRTITLTVPQGEYRKVARKAVALARRAAHPVRGHWRKHHWFPLSPLCEHEFIGDGEQCAICRGKRIWIDEHQRGDASLGFVTHDYEVKKDKPTA